ncbi:hypothetical protein [Nicoliella lavandulae]|uniref:Extracellular protein n=1 Tax=Nicoliella lavandulae TaxID=3082954 RepID=A0ABU8SMP2_9LACO
MKLVKWLAVVPITLVLVSSMDVGQAHAMTVHNQKQYAITSSPRVKLVYNRNITRGVPKEYSTGNYPGSGKLNHMRVNHGAKHVKFNTSIFLPHNGEARWTAPQSSAIVGHYAYVMYNYNGKLNDHRDFVVRYDLNKIHHHGLELGYTSNHKDGIKVGPVFNGGHGQSLAYNPKKKQLWFLNMGRGSYAKASAEQLSLKTLRPIYRINFRFSYNSSLMDNTLAFDNSGHAFTYVRSGGGNVRKGAYKIYRGSISRSGVHFNLMKTAIRHAAGPIPQGLGYNPKNDRLYFVSDGSIISAPAWKVNRLKKSDIRYVRVKTNREFEGLTFNRKGHGYLLTLRPPELMRMSGSF